MARETSQSKIKDFTFLLNKRVSKNSTNPILDRQRTHAGAGEGKFALSNYSILPRGFLICGEGWERKFALSNYSILPRGFLIWPIFPSA
jgi:hypothetical protein